MRAAVEEQIRETVAKQQESAFSAAQEKHDQVTKDAEQLKAKLVKVTEQHAELQARAQVAIEAESKAAAEVSEVQACAQAAGLKKRQADESLAHAAAVKKMVLEEAATWCIASRTLPLRTLQLGVLETSVHGLALALARAHMHPAESKSNTSFVTAAQKTGETPAKCTTPPQLTTPAPGARTGAHLPLQSNTSSAPSEQ